MDVALAYGRASKGRRIAALWDSFVAVGRVMKGAVAYGEFWDLSDDELTALSRSCDRALENERRRVEAAARR